MDLPSPSGFPQPLRMAPEATPTARRRVQVIPPLGSTCPIAFPSGRWRDRLMSASRARKRESARASRVRSCVSTTRTIRRAWADLERAYKALLDHEQHPEAGCSRCYRVSRYKGRSRQTRCISGLVLWRRWCRARDVLAATERLRSRRPRVVAGVGLERDQLGDARTWGLEPIKSRDPDETARELERINQEREAWIRSAPRRAWFRHWWRTRRAREGGD